MTSRYTPEERSAIADAQTLVDRLSAKRNRSRDPFEQRRLDEDADGLVTAKLSLEAAPGDADELRLLRARIKELDNRWFSKPNKGRSGSGS